VAVGMTVDCTDADVVGVTVLYELHVVVCQKMWQVTGQVIGLYES
jgi:hypothetical protein